MLCQLRVITNRVRGIPWPKIGATQYHAQLELPDKDSAIKGLVVSRMFLERNHALY